MAEEQIEIEPKGFLVVCGSPFCCGYNLELYSNNRGFFSTVKEAELWANENFDDGHWWVIPVS